MLRIVKECVGSLTSRLIYNTTAFQTCQPPYRYHSEHLPTLEKESQQAEDVERFRWFSQNYLGFDEEKNLVTDVRYSMLPNQIKPMWGLVIDDQRDFNQHAIWWTGRDLDQREWDIFIEMLSGTECRK